MASSQTSQFYTYWNPASSRPTGKIFFSDTYFQHTHPAFYFDGFARYFLSFPLNLSNWKTFYVTEQMQYMSHYIGDSFFIAAACVDLICFDLIYEAFEMKSNHFVAQNILSYMIAGNL